MNLFAYPIRGTFYDRVDPDNPIPIFIVGIYENKDGTDTAMIVTDEGDLTYVPIDRVVFTELAERLA